MVCTRLRRRCYTGRRMRIQDPFFRRMGCTPPCNPLYKLSLGISPQSSRSRSPSTPKNPTDRPPAERRPHPRPHACHRRPRLRAYTRWCVSIYLRCLRSHAHSYPTVQPTEQTSYGSHLPTSLISQHSTSTHPEANVRSNSTSITRPTLKRSVNYSKMLTSCYNHSKHSKLTISFYAFDIHLFSGQVGLEPLLDGDSGPTSLLRSILGLLPRA